MCLQKKVLDEYLGPRSPTLREIALDTGIQVTRVHRIMRGSAMRLDEYEIFRRKAQEREGGTKLQEMIAQIEECLSAEKIREIESLLERSLKIFSLTGQRVGP